MVTIVPGKVKEVDGKNTQSSPLVLTIYSYFKVVVSGY